MKKKIVSVMLAGALVFGTASVAQAASGWYELNGQLITVHVPLSGSASWDIVPISAEGLYLITSENSGDEWVATYSYDGEYEGYDRLEVICMVDGTSYGDYTVNLWYSENGDIEVTSDYGDDAVYTGSGSSDTDYDDSSDYTEETDFGQSGFASYTAYVTADSLILRDGPGTGYNVVGSLSNGEKVTVVGESNGWAMTYDESGRTGYCSLQYLSTTKSSSSSTSSSTNSSSSTDSSSKKTTETSSSETEETKVFEVSESGEVLTLRLPTDTKNQNTWKYKLSEENALELITQEIVEEDDNETWVASFKAAGSTEKETSFLANRVDEDQQIDMSYCLDLHIDADGTISVVNAQKLWLEADAKTGILTLNLPGNQEENNYWEYVIADTSKAELVTSTYIEEEDSKDDEAVTDGYWNGSFRGLEEGETLLTLTYKEDDQTKKTFLVQLTVDENENISVASIKLQ